MNSCARTRFAERLTLFSTSQCILGGVLLAANLDISKYGFIFLGVSSSTLFVSALLKKDTINLVYAGSLFLFVDLLGIVRWIL